MPERAFRDLRAQVRLGPRPAGSAREPPRSCGSSPRLHEAGVATCASSVPFATSSPASRAASPATVVVGAHHDTKDIAGFVGANDGASGVAVLLELARDLPRRLEGPSLDLVFFDAEESRGPGSDAAAFARSGDRGSRQYVATRAGAARMARRLLAEIRAMVLFDMVGDCDLEIPREANSDQASTRSFAVAAEKQTGEPGAVSRARHAGLRRPQPVPRSGRIPAVDLIDFAYGPGPTAGGVLAHAARTPCDTSARAASARSAARPWLRCRRSAEIAIPPARPAQPRGTRVEPTEQDIGTLVTFDVYRTVKVP